MKAHLPVPFHMNASGRTPMRETPPTPAKDIAASWRSRLRRQFSLVVRPRIEVGWASRCGTYHGHNQDAVLAVAPLFAVADGVGGGQAGELASSEMLAWCQALPPTLWRDARALTAHLPQADEALAARLRTLEPSGMSATTFVAAWLRPGGRCHVTHVGDARLLLGRLTGGALQWRQVTQDDTYAHLGESPPDDGKPDDPARMVGVGCIGNPPVQVLTLREGDQLILCSDGLHRFLDLPAIARRLALSEQAGEGLSVTAERLVADALAAASYDDISVVLVRLNPWAGARLQFWFAAASAIALAAVIAISW